MPDPQRLLLQLQETDLAADQLRHRRATLPERASITEAQAAIAALDAQLAEIGTRLGELERSQRRLEDDVASLVDKQSSESARMYSGSVTSPRELQAMQEEIDGLHRRQGELEDRLIEVMELAEPLQADVDRLHAERARQVEQLGAAQAALAESEAVVDAELDQVLAGRQIIVDDVPSDLVTTYDRLRDRLGGVAVARLEGAQCLGCHLSLPAVELDAVRHAAPDTLVTHEECGRILIRV